MGAALSRRGSCQPKPRHARHCSRAAILPEDRVPLARPETGGQLATTPCCRGQARPSRPLAGPRAANATFFRETRASPPAPMQGGVHAVTSGLRRDNGGLTLGEEQDLGAVSHLLVIERKTQGTAVDARKDARRRSPSVRRKPQPRCEGVSDPLEWLVSKSDKRKTEPNEPRPACGEVGTWTPWRWELT